MDKNRLEGLTLRRDIYAMFAAFLYRPEPDVAPEHLLHCLQELNQTLRLTIDEEIAKLRQWVEGGNITMESLQREYARLFVGPFSLPAPPYESCYRDSGARVMGDSTMNVLKHYHAVGLDIADEYKDVPDHVSLELDYLAKLCEGEAIAFEQGDKESAAALREKHDHFLNEHALRWMPSFTQAVKESATLPYYSAVCDALEGFLQTLNNEGG